MDGVSWNERSLQHHSCWIGNDDSILCNALPVADGMRWQWQQQQQQYSRGSIGLAHFCRLYAARAFAWICHGRMSCVLDNMAYFIVGPRSQLNKTFARALSHYIVSIATPSRLGLRLEAVACTGRSLGIEDDEEGTINP